jgi:hypothetical protein
LPPAAKILKNESSGSVESANTLQNQPDQLLAGEITAGVSAEGVVIRFW